MDRKKILIVEDDASLSLALRDGLLRAGFEPLMAENAIEGLEVALTELPDLILLDIIMPIMDGITMLKKLREDEKGKYLDVIILTNLSDRHKVKDAMSLGAHDYIIKADNKMEDLVHLIGDKLNTN